MARGTVSALIEMLKTPKGAALAAVAAVSVVALVGIGRSGRAVEPAGGGWSSMAAVAQTAKPAADPAKVFSPEQINALHQVIKDYLLQNPEVMVEVSKELERRQAAEQARAQTTYITQNKDKIFRQATDFVLGDPKGDITIVEFFDYNCGWCKRALDDINRLTKSDPKIRFVMKELPIFGENSTMAAKAAMASIRQGKYWEYHSALMREKQVTKDNMFQIAQRVGLDVNRLKADMADPKLEAALKMNNEIAQALNIEGTPGFIVDARVNVGYVPADGLRQMVAEIRKAGCQVC